MSTQYCVSAFFIAAETSRASLCTGGLREFRTSRPYQHAAVTLSCTSFQGCFEHETNARGRDGGSQGETGCCQQERAGYPGEAGASPIRARLRLVSGFKRFALSPHVAERKEGGREHSGGARCWWQGEQPSRRFYASDKATFSEAPRVPPQSCRQSWQRGPQSLSRRLRAPAGQQSSETSVVCAVI